MRLLIYHHLGLGDHFMCHGLVRHHAARVQSLALMVKHHNADTVAWMFHDLPNVTMVKVADDCEAVRELRRMRQCGWLVMALGYHSGDAGFTDTDYDQGFYRHAGVPFEERWSNFKAEPSANQVKAPAGHYCLVHSDDRMNIVPHIASRLPVVLIDSSRTNLFDWWNVLHGAAEIHCIPSSVYLLIDSLSPFPDVPLYLHKWARQGVTYPTHRKPWILLNEPPR